MGTPSRRTQQGLRDRTTRPTSPHVSTRHYTAAGGGDSETYVLRYVLTKADDPLDYGEMWGQRVVNTSDSGGGTFDEDENSAEGLFVQLFPPLGSGYKHYSVFVRELEAVADSNNYKATVAIEQNPVTSGDPDDDGLRSDQDVFDASIEDETLGTTFMPIDVRSVGGRLTAHVGLISDPSQELVENLEEVSEGSSSGE